MNLKKLFFGKQRIRMAQTIFSNKKKYGGPITANLFIDLANKPNEEAWIATFNNLHDLVGKHKIDEGIVNAIAVWPRKIFEKAFEDRACFFVLAHNHPSGNLEISEEDDKITERLTELGKALNCPLFDHYLITSSGIRSIPYRSFIEIV